MPAGQRTEVKNCRTMAVFLGPRHTTAEDREGSRKPRDMICREPIEGEGLAWVWSGKDSGVSGWVDELPLL